ncbi:MAG: DUF1566 domain-containing protein [Sulfuricurvum sp.]|nr:DUF1566 domain-containing protein [Sulfuricurvum sp.]
MPSAKSLYIFLLFPFFLWGETHLAIIEDFTQESAGEYCRSLGNGWHLMSIGEIYTLPQTAPFNPKYSYWSSDQTAADNSEIGTGSEGDGSKTSMLGYSFYPKERNITLSPTWKRISAACTDEVKPKRIREYKITPMGTIDSYSNILWHSLDATDKRTKYTYDDAKEMCDNLTLYGKSWRLPTIEELYRIVDYSFTRPSVDMKFFGVMMQRYYWSSDTLNEKEAYVVVKL